MYLRVIIRTRGDNMKIKITLNETLEGNRKLTRNAIAVQAKIRPATLHDIVKGNSKSITFATLGAILDAMNELDDTRSYDICDVFVYDNEEKAQAD